MESQTILKVENLSVKFEEERVLDNVSFEIKKGTIFAVVGPNGAGKTTLFRALFSFIPYEGKIEWQAGIKKGYVPQRLTVDSYFPISVLEFLNLKLKKEDKTRLPAGREAIFDVLKNVGFSEDEHHLEKHLLDKKLGSLSGGEFQKILIAFALLDKPDVLLFDEPTSGVDIGSEETIYHTLTDLRKKTGLTVIFISHDIQMVYRYVDNVLCLNKEAVCLGGPSQALSAEILEKLYGKEAGVFSHEHKKF